MATTQKTTTVNEPWEGQQPFIKQIMGRAQKNYENQLGFRAPDFDTFVPMSSQTQGALGNMWNAAAGGNPLAGQSMGALGSMLGGNINNRYNTLYNQAGAGGPLAGQTQGVLSGAMGGQLQGPLGGQITGALGGILGGGGGGANSGLINQQLGEIIGGQANQTGIVNNLNSMYANADNPHFAEALQGNLDRAADTVSRQFSGLGRYQSGAHVGEMTRELGNISANALSNQWNQDIANQRGILSDLSAVKNQNVQNRMAAAGLQNQIDRGGTADTLSAAGLAGSLNNQDIGNRLQAAGMADSQYNQRLANQRGVLGDTVGAQMGAIGAAPGAYQQQYLPYERQAQVGAAYDDLAARQLQAKIDKFNTAQQAPWNRLNAYQGAVAGTGQYQNTAQTVQNPNNILGQIFGGALGGASLGNMILPGWGTAVGALGGAAYGGLNRL